MLKYFLPIALVVVSNIMYHICAKSVPDSADTFASLTVTYLIGAVTAAVLYFVFNKGGNILNEYSKIGWAPYVLGIVIVGLEVGSILVYRAGWHISEASIIENAALAVALLLVGWLFYHESMAWNKIIGMAVCIVGLFIINR